MRNSITHALVMSSESLAGAGRPASRIAPSDPKEPACPQRQVPGYPLLLETCSRGALLHKIELRLRSGSAFQSRLFDDMRHV
eukprot:6385175-Prymnesium_polylepis.1